MGKSDMDAISSGAPFPYLHVESFAVFVAQETIDALIRRFDSDPQVFEPVQKTVTDHVGESGLMTIIVTHGAELLLLPFNHFHYELDYEIGLTIDHSRTIPELEQSMSSLGWEYESGTMEQDGTRSYYLIPTRSGAFPGFFAVSSLDVTRNTYLTSLQSFTAGVRTGAISAAVEFAATFLHAETAMFRFKETKRNRFISASFNTDLPQSLVMDERIGCLRFEVRDTVWNVSVAE